MTVTNLSYSTVAMAANALAARAAELVPAPLSVMPVLRGGLYPATIVAERLHLPLVAVAGASTLIVDDLVDSGATAKRYDGQGLAFDACFRKAHSPAGAAPDATELGGWAVFPWEIIDGHDTSAHDGVIRLLEHIGEDPTRDGLLDTPRRVVKAFGEMTDGYGLDPAEILGTTFDETCDEMVVLRGIDFVSLCEHHLLPFTGTADVAYIPGARVVGLSKLARLVDAYAHRLQIQERLTQQIATAIETNLGARGVGVVIRANHSCMGCRGVRKPNAEMVTSALLGFMKDDPAARAEFLTFASL